MTKPLSQQIAEIRPDKPLPAVRISPKVRQAIRHMVWDGDNRPAAAQRAGITDSALYRAMRLPKVKALFAQELAELRESGPARAYINIMGMADDAKSEDVKLRANQWVAGVDGLAPVSKVQGNITVRHGFEGYAFARPDSVIDGTLADQGQDGGEDPTDTS